MRILITGVGGQVGGKLAGKPPPPGSTIIRADRSTLDLAQPDTIRRAFAMAAPDVVVNCAAYTNVEAAEDERDLAYRVNEAAPGVLAELCAAAHRPLIHLSTDYVFDGNKIGGYVPDDAIGPLNVYGASKEAGERAVRERLDRHLILRSSWIYCDAGRNFLRTMLSLGATKDEIAVVADQRGSPSSADSLADAISSLLGTLARGEELTWGTCHLANRGGATWHEFAEAIFAGAAPFIGRQPRVRPITTSQYPTRARRPANSELDCRSSEAALGVTLRGWREALRDVLSTMFPRAPYP